MPLGRQGDLEGTEGVILNEQGFWRLMIAASMGAVAALIAAMVALVVSMVRKDVSMEVPITAGVSVAAAAYFIDWYTEKKGQQG